MLSSTSNRIRYATIISEPADSRALRIPERVEVGGKKGKPGLLKEDYAAIVEYSLRNPVG
jgi:hypothetical protein